MYASTVYSAIIEAMVRTSSRPRCSNLHVVPPSSEGTCHQRMPTSLRPPMFLVNQKSTTISTVAVTKLTMKFFVNQVQKK